MKIGQSFTVTIEREREGGTFTVTVVREREKEAHLGGTFTVRVERERGGHCSEPKI